MRILTGLLVLVMAATTSAATFPTSIQTHFDLIPIYGNTPTIVSVKNGDWSDPKTWDLNRVPNATDSVGITANRSVQFNTAAECLDLVVAGNLTGNAGFALSARTVTVLPTGNLQLLSSGSVTFRDIPIDTVFDPAQYGNGLIVIDGVLNVQGQAKDSWVQLGQEVAAGVTQLTLATAPASWNVGDVLVLPDTRQPFYDADIAEGSRQIELVRIAAVSGQVVQLQSPVLYSHNGWHKQSGEVVLYPAVGNLTRSIVFRSANPTGTRGHVFLTGKADTVARYVELDDLGRTTVAPLDSYTASPLHIGTNQIGRYAWHFHHCLGPLNSPKPYQFEISGSAINSSPKWGVAIHDSHYGAVKSNTIYGARGAAIVTESVNEYASFIEDNLIIWCQGSGQRITARSNRNDPKGDFWHSGVGLGLESATCTIRRNKIFNAKEGIGMAGFRTSAQVWPLVRGGGTEPGDKVTPKWYQNPYYYPFLFPTNDNLVWGCWRGIETWTADSWPNKLDMFPGLTIVHTKQGTDLNDQEETYIKQWSVLGDFARAALDTIGLKFKDSYEFGVTVINSEFRGNGLGYTTVSPNEYTNFSNCVFENRINVYEPLGRIKGPWVGTWQDTQFIPVGSYPLQILKVSTQPFFRGPYFSVTRGDQPDDKMLTYNVVYRFLNNNFSGENVRVYHYYQVPSTPFPSTPLPAGQQWNDFPVDVLSNGDAWTRYGLRILGAFAPASAMARPEYDGYLVNIEDPISYPSIITPVVTFSSNTAVVTFGTDVPAKAQVRYSQGGFWRWTAWTGTLTTLQSVSIPGLTSGATYTFYLYAMDGNDNLNVVAAKVTGKVP